MSKRERARRSMRQPTMQFYVGRSAEATADVVWQAFAKAATIGNGKSDSLSDSRQKSAENGDEPKGSE
jgi:hypothetical protein